MLDLQGLSLSEVSALQAAGKTNNVPLASSRSYREILAENLLNFINIVFFTISVVMIILHRYSDAFLVVVVICSGVFISIYQEISAKRQLDKIALLNRPQATAIRDRQLCEIDAKEIVLGDLLVVHTGDQILVDGELVGNKRIEVDESLLTGESELVVKNTGDSLYSGSFCVSGSGHYRTQKVGSETVAYKLVTGARAFRQVYTPLQQEINLIIRVLLLIAIFLWILVSLSFFSRGLSLEELVERAAVIAGLVPAGLLIAITIAYGTGAVRMLKESILIQQANAVESLSNVDVLCLDKTGTLTTNQLVLESIYQISDTDIKSHLADYAANTSTPNHTTEAIALAYSGTTRTVAAEVPFSSARKWSAITFDDGVYVLGAPEILATTVPLTEAMQAQIQAGVEQGWRVLLFAHSHEVNNWNADISQPVLPSQLMPLAILQFSDRLRPQVKETLAGFTQAGIEVKIISGDNPDTVKALAVQIGFNRDLETISGLELSTLDQAQFAQAATNCTVFGRITPEQKAKLVQTLRHQGRYVAMIGDGVNDVLSLKQANLGIAMESGSKATRAVADIVLLKDSFSALPHAFLEGQTIRNGIRDSLALFIVRVFCVTLLIFATAIVTESFPLTNKHSALIALFGVGLPTAVFPIWAKPGNTYRRQSLVRSLLHFTIPATLTITLLALCVYLGYLVKVVVAAPENADLANLNYNLPRTAMVTLIIFCHLCLLPFLKPPIRAWAGGAPMSGDWRYTIAACLLLLLYLIALAVPFLRNFFELAPLSWQDVLFLLGVTLEWCFIQRTIWRRRFFDKFLGKDLGLSTS
ncbi:HAD-IC family P-type ATPase [Merismopedia glauca]|uniref:Haloacid dehalogenase n=1 Tax=Merismopedia glauca CCAP 1448/3 TaxID=1296344 RepID=A0A2T1C179_9CYAN|nr:HAD-IC family P-type ATPase [Merismopedia glauca]PSB01883.1 haloacid dehalogenase [Merismopedia glauca CCAP 1448/3]